MASPESSSRDICSLSPEILTMILSKLSAKSVLNVGETCKHLRDVVFGCDVLWKRLCMNDYNFDLQVKGPFQSFASIYELIYKYRAIVANHQYGKYIPEYYCHWGVLLEEGSKGFSLRTGFWRCTNSRLKRTWEITKNRLHARGPRKDVTIDTIKSKLGVDDRKQFQQAVLQRCIRNQKKICQHFVSASMTARSNDLRWYIDDNPSAKPILLTNTPITQCPDSFIGLSKSSLSTMPNDVGMDFIKGHFHKVGLEQVKCYVKFVKGIKEFYMPKSSLSEVVDAIFVPVYRKLRKIAKLRLITFKEYVDIVEEYLARIEEIEKWQEETEEHLKISFVFEGLHEKKSYRYYVLYGKQDDLISLKNHYEGLINVKLWLRSNLSIESLLGSTIVNVLRGEPLGSILENIPRYKEIEDCMKKYLETSKTKHFRRLIRKLWQYAFKEHEKKAEYLEKLQNNLIEKKVFPPYTKPPSQDESADTSNL